jgi:hypothetical protein
MVTDANVYKTKSQQKRQPLLNPWQPSRLQQQPDLPLQPPPNLQPLPQPKPQPLQPSHLQLWPEIVGVVGLDILIGTTSVWTNLLTHVLALLPPHQLLFQLVRDQLLQPQSHLLPLRKQLLLPLLLLQLLDSLNYSLP